MGARSQRDLTIRKPFSRHGCRAFHYVAGVIHWGSYLNVPLTLVCMSEKGSSAQRNPFATMMIGTTRATALPKNRDEQASGKDRRSTTLSRTRAATIGSLARKAGIVQAKNFARKQRRSRPPRHPREEGAFASEGPQERWQYGIRERLRRRSAAHAQLNCDCQARQAAEARADDYGARVCRDDQPGRHQAGAEGQAERLRADWESLVSGDAALAAALKATLAKGPATPPEIASAKKTKKARR